MFGSSAVSPTTSVAHVAPTVSPTVPPVPIPTTTMMTTHYQPQPLDPAKDVIAMDCEMVGVGPGGVQSVVARVSLVDWYGRTVLDTHVKVLEKVTDYRSHVSGIQPHDLKNAMDFGAVRNRVEHLLSNKILVGHGLSNDLKVLGLRHAPHMTRDSATYPPFLRVPTGTARRLKELVATELGLSIQQLGCHHDSIDDAKAAMALYKKHQAGWDYDMRPRAMPTAMYYNNSINEYSRHPPPKVAIQPTHRRQHAGMLPLFPTQLERQRVQAGAVLAANPRDNALRLTQLERQQAQEGAANLRDDSLRLLPTHLERQQAQAGAVLEALRQTSRISPSVKPLPISSKLVGTSYRSALPSQHRLTTKSPGALRLSQEKVRQHRATTKSPGVLRSLPSEQAPRSLRVLPSQEARDDEALRSLLSPTRRSSDDELRLFPTQQRVLTGADSPSLADLLFPGQKVGGPRRDEALRFSFNNSPRKPAGTRANSPTQDERFFFQSPRQPTAANSEAQMMDDAIREEAVRLFPTRQQQPNTPPGFQTGVKTPPPPGFEKRILPEESMMALVSPQLAVARASPVPQGGARLTSTTWASMVSKSVGSKKQ